MFRTRFGIWRTSASVCQHSLFILKLKPIANFINRRFTVTVDDCPGGIADLCRRLADIGVSIKDIMHERAWLKDIYSVEVSRMSISFASIVWCIFPSGQSGVWDARLGACPRTARRVVGQLSSGGIQRYSSGSVEPVLKSRCSETNRQLKYRKGL